MSSKHFLSVSCCPDSSTHPWVRRIGWSCIRLTGAYVRILGGAVPLGVIFLALRLARTGEGVAIKMRGALGSFCIGHALPLLVAGHGIAFFLLSLELLPAFTFSGDGVSLAEALFNPTTKVATVIAARNLPIIDYSSLRRR